MGISRRMLRITVVVIAGMAFYGQSTSHPLSSVSLPLQGSNYYQVTEFYDGDTISVNMNGSIEKVRFIGVDTPETHHPSKPVQCFGEAASSYTKKLIGSQKVRLEADPSDTNRDRYGRLLRYVYLLDGTLVNEKLIRDGYGFAYVGFPFTKLETFKANQQTARNEDRGLWSSCPTETDDHGQIHSL